MASLENTGNGKMSNSYRAYLEDKTPDPNPSSQIAEEQSDQKSGRFFSEDTIATLCSDTFKYSWLAEEYGKYKKRSEEKLTSFNISSTSPQYKTQRPSENDQCEIRDTSLNKAKNYLFNFADNCQSKGKQWTQFSGIANKLLHDEATDYENRCENHETVTSSNKDKISLSSEQKGGKSSTSSPTGNNDKNKHEIEITSGQASQTQSNNVQNSSHDRKECMDSKRSVVKESSQMCPVNSLCPHYCRPHLRRSKLSLPNTISRKKPYAYTMHHIMSLETYYEMKSKYSLHESCDDTSELDTCDSNTANCFLVEEGDTPDKIHKMSFYRRMRARFKVESARLHSVYKLISENSNHHSTSENSSHNSTSENSNHHST